MYVKVYLFLLFWLSSVGLMAQSSIVGTIVDGADNAKLEKASIALLHQSDSILVRFSWTKDNGTFLLNHIDTGNYKLIISYPKYADYSKDILLDGSNLSIGTIKLSKASLLLDEVTVVGSAPITLRGDTTVYNASSFQVAKDANVEDLLKVLPGITVDANGNITAQGKEVKKVLLDGEEFFGNDPKLITKNIRSNMVDKVLVYEKKSDIATRTGVDDGERIQTIDITLKEDMKKGMFGQALAGAGTDDYYGGKAMLNKFKGSEKIAVYGIAANDGMVSLGFEDGQKYGVGSDSNVEIDGGSIFISSNSNSDVESDWNGGFSGNGVPKAFNFGASYSNKFKKDKHKVNVNFQRTQMSVDNNSTFFSQDNLPDAARIINSIGKTANETKNNNANLRYDLKIDSLSELTVRLGYIKSNRENQSKSNTLQQNLDMTLINEIEEHENGNNGRENVNASILLTRKFLKPRRSISLNASAVSGKNDSESYYFSLTDFAEINSELRIDQRKEDETKNTNYTVALNYSEPLSKRLTGTLGYSIGNSNSSLLNQSYDKNPVTGSYDILDQNLLNDFNTTTISNGINAGLNYKSEYLTLNISNRFSFESLERTYQNENSRLNRNQNSIAPVVSLNYKLSKSKSVNLYYNGRTTQPSLNQIEPLNQNRESTVKYLPNADLKGGFRNSFSMSYNSYKQIKDQSFYAWMNFSQSTNDVTSKVNYYSATGERDISFVNMEKPNLNASLYTSFRRSIWKRFNLGGNMGGNVSYNNSYNYLAINNGESALNNNQTYSISPNVGINSYKANKWSLYLNVSPGMQFRKSSLQPELNSNNFTFETYADLSYTLPKDYKIVLNMNQRYEGASSTLKAFNVVNMSGYVSKKFLKDKSMEAQIFVNDILDRNNGVNRSQYGYSFTQTTNDVLRRYVMFKLIYNFTTMKGAE